MLTIAALNAPKAPSGASSRGGLVSGGAGGGGGGGAAAAGETLEAAEARCVSSFEAALSLVQSDPAAAKVRGASLFFLSLSSRRCPLVALFFTKSKREGRMRTERRLFFAKCLFFFF